MQVHVADHLEERPALHAGLAQAEDAAGPLVQQEDVVVAVGGDDPLDHGVEDGGGLGLLALEIVDLLAEAPRHDVEGAAERADLVGGTHGGAHPEIALAHLASHVLHLDHGARHPSCHEEPDAERHDEGDRAPRQHDAAERFVGGGGRLERRGEPQGPHHPAGLRHGHRHVDEGCPQRARAPHIPTGASVERGADLGSRRVIFHLGHVCRAPLGVGEHPPVGGDEGDPRVRAPGRPLGERLEAPRLTTGPEARARLVLEHPSPGSEPRLDGLDGHALKAPGKIEAHEHHGHRNEAHQGQGELEGDAPAKSVNNPGEHQLSGSRRYPTLLTVRMRCPSGPSLTRSRRTCTSTVRDSISPARE